MTTESAGRTEDHPNPKDQDEELGEENFKKKPRISFSPSPSPSPPPPSPPPSSATITTTTTTSTTMNTNTNTTNSSRLWLSKVNYNYLNTDNNSDNANNVNVNNVNVNNVSNNVKNKKELEQVIQKVFEAYGKVLEVFLSDRSKKQYGFVSMETAEGAQRALDDLGMNDNTNNNDNTDINNKRQNNNKHHNTLFQRVQLAETVAPRNKKANKRQLRLKQEYQHKLDLALNSNIICQLHRSHVQRLVDLVQERYKIKTNSDDVDVDDDVDDDDDVDVNNDNNNSDIDIDIDKNQGQTAKVVGSMPASSKTVTLIFVQASDQVQFTKWLESLWFVQPIVHRIFCLSLLSSGAGGTGGTGTGGTGTGTGGTGGTGGDGDGTGGTGGTGGGTGGGGDGDGDSGAGGAGDSTGAGAGTGVVQGSLEQDVIPAIFRLLSSSSLPDHSRFRVHVFPPKLQGKLLQALDAQWEHFDKKDVMGFTPTNTTHSLRVVQLQQEEIDININNNININIDSNNNNSNGIKGLYCLGLNVTEHMPQPTPSNKLTNGMATQEDDICRAYWKLQEAFERYRYALPGDDDDDADDGDGSNTKTKTNITKNPTITALDCGAAPGGWTLFLSQRYNNNKDKKKSCCKIYSIDPGNLSPTVLSLEQVEHWPMTIQKALPQLLLLQKDKGQQQSSTSSNIIINASSSSSSSSPPPSPGTIIQVWVSDMCVKDMKQQVDLFLQARSMGVVGAGTFFCLTLKCIVGHSSSTFDHLVDVQLERLQPLAEKIQRLHLFTNRISERTIMGYLI